MIEKLVADYAFWKFLAVDVIAAVVVAVWVDYKNPGKRFEVAVIAMLFVGLSCTLELRIALVELSEQTKLALERVPISADLNAIARNYVSVTRLNSSFFEQEARKTVEDARRTVEDLAKGFAQYKPDDVFEKAIESFELAKRTVVATSVVTSSNFWESNDGQRYAEANYRAAKKTGVVIRRLFIFGSIQSAIAARSVIKAQEANQIAVRVLVEPNSRVQDYAIFDEEYIAFLDMNQAGVPISMRYARSEAERSAKRSEFERLWANPRSLSLAELNDRAPQLSGKKVGTR